jgi:NodT family efflux transporter outer membrane factor (OMF) lipoprotein
VKRPVPGCQTIVKILRPDSPRKGDSPPGKQSWGRPCFLIAFLALMFSWGCTKLGPDFVRPDAPLSPEWLDARGGHVNRGPADYRAWWRVFNDPDLNRLVEKAYRQNLSVRIAGVRVLEARALLAVAVGALYPQNQHVSGSLQYNRISDRSPIAGPGSSLSYEQAQIGLSASWELDFWGKFRRAIESADANLAATVADYDDALVSLTGDVANSYILIKTLLRRIDIARLNVETQSESLNIAEARFQAGTTSQRDVEQAKTLLNSTRASIPTLEGQLRQAKNALSVLLGLPPNDLSDLLTATRSIPVPPAQIAVGIPADLLRRRPDIRSAEYQAAAQSARIGLAEADLYPAFSLSGTLGLLASNVGPFGLGDSFRWGSLNYAAGPGLQWNVFNYGRLTNSVRVQDARFQQLLIAYQSTVLRAQQEVEDGLAAFLRARERAEFLARSAASARRSVDLASLQYREGATDFTTVLTAGQGLLSEQDNLASTLGDVARNLVSVYRALGGGWQIREETGVAVAADIRETMAKRTDWGSLLDPFVVTPPSGTAGKPLIRPPQW